MVSRIGGGPDEQFWRTPAGAEPGECHRPKAADSR
jgi:hypothetical protein